MAVTSATDQFKDVNPTSHPSHSQWGKYKVAILKTLTVIAITALFTGLFFIPGAPLAGAPLILKVLGILAPGALVAFSEGIKKLLSKKPSPLDGVAIQVVDIPRFASIAESPDLILRVIEKPITKGFHWTSAESAQSIIKNGFKLGTSGGSKLGPAVYVMANKTGSADYGDTLIALQLKIRKAAYLDNDNYKKIHEKTSNLDSKTATRFIRDLFVKNGYQAIEYDFEEGTYDPPANWDAGSIPKKKTAVAIYDLACITQVEDVTNRP